MLRPVEVIMYRTPGEAMLWHSGMLWPIMSSAFWAFVLTLMVLKLVNSTGIKYRADYLAIGTLIVSFIGILHFIYGV